MDKTSIKYYYQTQNPFKITYIDFLFLKQDPKRHSQ